MKAQPLSSPIICSQAETIRKPVPLEAGWGMVRVPLNSGLVRSAQLVGVGSLRLAASTVLKHTAEDHRSMPTQVGVARGSRMLARTASRPLGA